MTADAAAVTGLTRIDPRGAGITRVRTSGGFAYLDASGAPVSGAETMQRIKALAIPPAWNSVWISPDPLGHIQATGVDSRGRTQYRYHQLWREQRDAQKFAHMLRFADALPGLRGATMRDLRHRQLDRDRVAGSAVRLIDLGLFRLGSERYAELDHHYGAATLEKRHVSLRRGAAVFDYVGKEGKRRAITIDDPAVVPTVRALARSDNGAEALFCFQDAGGGWRPLHSHDVSAYIAGRAGGHFTAKEFRTWNATVLMALLLATTDLPSSARAAKTAINVGVRGVAEWLGDTPAVARASYIDPRLIQRYESDGRLTGVPALPARLPAGAEAESAVAALLADTAEPSLYFTCKYLAWKLLTDDEQRRLTRRKPGRWPASRLHGDGGHGQPFRIPVAAGRSRQPHQASRHRMTLAREGSATRSRPRCPR